MTEFITTDKSDLTGSPWFLNQLSGLYSGTTGNDGETTLTTTATSDPRVQRTVSVGSSIANTEFTFAVTVRKPAVETEVSARLLISNPSFGDLLTKSITLTDSDVVESITHTFGAGTTDTSIVVRVDYPEPAVGTTGHEIILSQASLVDVVATAAIDNVDGDGEVTDGQGSATLTTSGFGSDINSITVTDGTYTTDNLFVSGSAGSWVWSIPDILNQPSDSPAGQPNWFEGSLEVIASDGVDSASAPFVWNPAIDAATQVVIGAADVEGSIYKDRPTLPPDNSSNYYPTTDNTAITQSGIISTDATSVSGVLWDATDGTLENWSFTIESGAIFSGGSLSLGIGIGLSNLFGRIGGSADQSLWSDGEAWMDVDPWID